MACVETQNFASLQIKVATSPLFLLDVATLTYVYFASLLLFMPDVATLKHLASLETANLYRPLSLHLMLITTFGLKPNEYSGTVQSVVTMDDLFTD